MNKLDREARSRILHLLCEGSSIRAIARVTGASKNTIVKLVVDGGKAASWYQHRVFRNLACKRLQVDEIWNFVWDLTPDICDAMPYRVSRPDGRPVTPSLPSPDSPAASGEGREGVPGRKVRAPWTHGAG